LSRCLNAGFLVDGSLFYYLTIVPDTDAGAFEEVFRHVAASIRLLDGC